MLDEVYYLKGQKCSEGHPFICYVKNPGKCIKCSHLEAKAKKKADREARRLLLKTNKVRKVRQKRLVEVSCKVCSKKFLTESNDSHRRKTCSAECFKEDCRNRFSVQPKRFKIRKCVVCSGPFINPNRSGRKTCCNSDCYEKLMRLSRWAGNPLAKKFRKTILDKNRRARKRNAEGRYAFNDIAALYEKQKGLCKCCAKDLRDGYHIDHIMPLVRGGSNWPSNLQLLCPYCNISKGAKHPEIWAKEVGVTLYD